MTYFTSIVKQNTENSRMLFFLGLLASKFDQISDKSAREYFLLLDTLINMYAEANIEEQTNIYDPEKLLSQIIDKIREIQDKTRLAKIPIVEE